MVVSTDERKRKFDKREYDSPPPLPCTPKELDVLLNKWIVDGVLSLTKFPESPPKKSGETRIFAACTILCNILLQNIGHSAD